VLDEYTCVLYTSGQEESMEHLFFNCAFSQWCWRLLHISRSQLDNHLDRIVDGRRKFGNRMYREVFLIACWAIWCHRNEIIFDGVHASLNRWKQLFRQEFQLLLHRGKPALEVEFRVWFCNFQ
jgi:hypothetical protein